MGPRVIALLRGRRLPPDVGLYDAGTDGMAVIYRAEGARRLIIVDARAPEAAPGAIYEVAGALLEAPPPASFNLHDFRWDHALYAGRRIHGAAFPAEVTVILVEAASLALGLGLTPAVEAAAARVADRIAALTGAAGVSARVAVRAGAVYLPAAVAETYFRGIAAVMVLIRDGALEVLPVRQMAAGGCLLKIAQRRRRPGGQRPGRVLRQRAGGLGRRGARGRVVAGARGVSGAARGELKNTFCLLKDGQAILSQHMGDLEDAATHEEAGRNLGLYARLFDHAPTIIAVDAHPDYLSTWRGYAMAGARPVIEVQHHHAHIAACLAENGRSLDAAPVLGIAMDGLGLGPDGTIWGGEFLRADYRGFSREGCLKPVALPGGAAAVREPWRNAYAQLMAEMGWAEFAMNFRELAVFERLQAAPRATLDAMIAGGVNAPLSSSCGRLFDAAAALAGLAWDRQDYEGQAAMLLEAAIDPAALAEPDELAYPFALPRLGGTGLPYVEPLAVWRALLGDLIVGTPVGVISARFHRGLAGAIVRLARKIGRQAELDTVALSGGCFQNATLFRLVHEGLEAAGFSVLSHSATPANDGGLALGQAVVALAASQAGGSHVPRDSGPDR